MRPRLDSGIEISALFRPLHLHLPSISCGRETTLGIEVVEPWLLFGSPTGLLRSLRLLLALRLVESWVCRIASIRHHCQVLRQRKENLTLRTHPRSLRACLHNARATFSRCEELLRKPHRLDAQVEIKRATTSQLRPQPNFRAIIKSRDAMWRGRNSTPKHCSTQSWKC